MQSKYLDRDTRWKGLQFLHGSHDIDVNNHKLNQTVCTLTSSVLEYRAKKANLCNCSNTYGLQFTHLYPLFCFALMYVNGRENRAWGSSAMALINQPGSLLEWVRWRLLRLCCSPPTPPTGPHSAAVPPPPPPPAPRRRLLVNPAGRGLVGKRGR